MRLSILKMNLIRSIQEQLRNQSPVQLRMETIKAKEMTKASLHELLITREELSEANAKLAQYEQNVQKVIDSMQGNAATTRTR